jgi:hypothetical protein
VGTNGSGGIQTPANKIQHFSSLPVPVLLHGVFAVMIYSGAPILRRYSATALLFSVAGRKGLAMVACTSGVPALQHSE